ncbi:unnamed protein product [Tenebrio molitor]|nr:unnamed protein product [Tenebrio molitor]
MSKLLKSCLFSFKLFFQYFKSQTNLKTMRTLRDSKCYKDTQLINYIRNFCT